MYKVNDNLVYPSLWDFKRSLTCCIILGHGTSDFASHLKEDVLQIFIALQLRFKPVTFRSSGKYINHYTTKATCWNDTDRENQKNSGEKLVPVLLSTLSTTNSTWFDPGTNLGLHGERLATNCLSNGRDSTLN
jgi:hypothetical protein